MSKINQTGLRPLGRAVLCEIWDPETKKSMIAIPQTVKDRQAMVETRMRVLEVGPACWADEDSARAKAGDIVLVSKYAGATAKSPKNGKIYRLVNADDIFCMSDEGLPAQSEDYEAGSLTAREA